MLPAKSSYLQIRPYSRINTAPKRLCAYLPLATHAILALSAIITFIKGDLLTVLFRAISPIRAHIGGEWFPDDVSQAKLEAPPNFRSLFVELEMSLSLSYSALKMQIDQNSMVSLARNF